MEEEGEEKEEEEMKVLTSLFCKQSVLFTDLMEMSYDKFIYMKKWPLYNHLVA